MRSVKAYCAKAMVDYYHVLGVKDTSSVKEIKAAYKRLARLLHPDLNGGSRESAQAFVKISLARDVLIDPRRRAEYDAQRRAHAAGVVYATVVKTAGDAYTRRSRSDVRINKDLEAFLMNEREEARALRQSLLPIVALLLAAFFVPVVRPHFWRSSGWTGRAVILILVSVGVLHIASKIWTAVKLRADNDQAGAATGEQMVKRWSIRQTVLLIGLVAIASGLLGTLIGMSLSDSLLIAMPMFFQPSIRLELLLYPLIIVWLIDAGHSLSQRLDI